MTWREKIGKKQPERVDDTAYGGMIGCPADMYSSCIEDANDKVCTKCWDREVPEEYLTQEDNESDDKKREGSVESETTADVIADMYHRLIDRGFPSGTAEIIVYKMIDHGYFDNK